MRITDQGSHLRKATVEIAGVPATGLVDTGADITIMGPELFKKVRSCSCWPQKETVQASRQTATHV